MILRGIEVYPVVRTPDVPRNFRVSAYARVITAPTYVAMTLGWHDASGANQYAVMQPSVPLDVGGHSCGPVFINAAGAITLYVDCGTVNQVYISASIEEAE